MENNLYKPKLHLDFLLACQEEEAVQPENGAKSIIGFWNRVFGQKSLKVSLNAGHV